MFIKYFHVLSSINKEETKKHPLKCALEINYALIIDLSFKTMSLHSTVCDVIGDLLILSLQATRFTDYQDFHLNFLGIHKI